MFLIGAKLDKSYASSVVKISEFDAMDLEPSAGVVPAAVFYKCNANNDSNHVEEIIPTTQLDLDTLFHKVIGY